MDIIKGRPCLLWIFKNDLKCLTNSPNTSQVFIKLLQRIIIFTKKKRLINSSKFYFLVNTTFGIAPPVVSEWMNIAANGADSEVELTRSHTLNELPMKVDVQIRVQHESTYYYFNAQSSAQSGSYNTEYGGVIYMFDESNVRIIAPGPSNCPSCNGYVLLLGNSLFQIFLNKKVR